MSRPACRLVLFAALALACGGEADAPPGDTDAPGVRVTLEPARVSVPAGTNASIVAHLTRTGGFTGPVGLDLVDIPPSLQEHVAGAFSLDATTAARSTLQLVVERDTPVGTYALAVRVEPAQQGLAPVTTPLELTVTPPEP